MEKEDQIIAMLEKQNEVLESQGKTLEQHGEMLESQGETLEHHSEMLESQRETLEQHSEMLESQGETLEHHSEMLESQGETLEQHNEMLKSHGETLEDHSQKLQDHSQILHALLSGQEHLKAELDGLKVSTTKEFDTLKHEQEGINIKLDVLHKDTWTNKLDIQRIKKTMGME